MAEQEEIADTPGMYNTSYSLSFWCCLQYISLFQKKENNNDSGITKQNIFHKIINNKCI